MNQPLKANPPPPPQKKKQFTKEIKYLKTPTKEPNPTKMADIVPAALLEMDPTMGNPQVYIK